MLGGRGSGKTRSGAEWLKGVALQDPHYPGNSGGRVALVGTSYDDMRDVMVEGESGLLAIHGKSNRPQWISSRKELIWKNGTIGKLYSSANPEGLRGNQFGAVWCDEVCKWSNLDETWDLLQFCLRLGNDPRQVVTTTPKPLVLLRKIMEDPRTITVRSTTAENAGNLADGFLDYVESIYGGTWLGRQELEGEIIENNENALWQRELIEASRVSKVPELTRIAIAVDPPAGSGTNSASCGIIAAGKTRNGRYCVLADKTLANATPGKWAAEVISLYHYWEADLIVAEVNQGGDMVNSIIHNLDSSVPVKPVHATRGKWTRAEPVALLYERGLVSHAGRFPRLEDQMCSFTFDGMSEGKSPDRVDALVWAISALAFTHQGEPRITTI